MPRPKIILIMSDNQPANLLGCYGNDEVQTANLDSLAQCGLRFDNILCAMLRSSCRAPVRIGMMPGQHEIDSLIALQKHETTTVNFTEKLKNSIFIQI